MDNRIMILRNKTRTINGRIKIMRKTNDIIKRLLNEADNIEKNTSFGFYFLNKRWQYCIAVSKRLLKETESYYK